MSAPAPAARPHLLLDGEVDRRETHISWVFLTADRAYKVKKPLVLPFVDYGSPARRRAMCEAEVALNRRLAPDIYLGVRGLVPVAGGLRLGDPDDPAVVDHAVEMVRFDDAETLASRLRAGTAGHAELRAVGARLAAFHAAAALVPQEEGAGAEPVKRTLDDNFATLHSITESGRARIARAERSAGAALASRWGELDARAARGRVRDGHGDLRLEHVLLGDEISFVDCVEFDPGLRRIDVAADVAFLAMELLEAGQAPLADTLAASYRATGGDLGDDALLAFFTAYRAEVRAKVALMRAAQLDRETASAKRERAARLLELAARRRWAVATPLVLVLAGLSASGKSTVTRALADTSGFVHVNSDIVRKRQAGLDETDRAPASLYADDVSRATYGALGQLAAERAGAGVIVDATFRRRVDRDAFRDALGRDVPVLFVQCQAPGAVLLARARARARDRGRVSDAGVEIVRRQLREAEPFDELAAAQHVIVRSDRPVSDIVDAVTDAVDARVGASVLSHLQDRSSRGVQLAV